MTASGICQKIRRFDPDRAVIRRASRLHVPDSKVQCNARLFARSQSHFYMKTRDDLSAGTPLRQPSAKLFQVKETHKGLAPEAIRSCSKDAMFLLLLQEVSAYPIIACLMRVNENSVCSKRINGMKTLRIFFPYGQLPHDLIVKAWEDESFKDKLLKNPNEAFQELGYEPPAETTRVVVNTNSEAFFVLPEMPASLQGASRQDMLEYTIKNTGDKASGTCD